MGVTAGTVCELLDETISRRAAHVALVHGSQRLSYERLGTDVSGVAGRLRQAGILPGDYVALVLPPGADFVRAFFGVLRCGAVALPLSPDAPDGELAAVTDAAPVSLALAADPPSAALTRGSLSGVRVTSLSALLDDAPAGAAGTVGAGPRPEDLAAVFHTSGTAGRPKAVMHTHRSLVASVQALSQLYREYFSRIGLQRAGRLATTVLLQRLRPLRALGHQAWATPMAPHSIAGFRVLLQALTGGHRFVVMERFHPDQTLRLVERERVSVLAVTPAMLEAILRLPDVDRPDVSCLGVIGLGAAPARSDLVRRARRRFGCPVVVGYGSTETGGGVLVTRLGDDDERSSETVGLPFPNAEVRVVDDHHREVPRGAVGELACRFDGAMAGYLGDPESTRRAVDAEGWYYTGDLAVMDASGYVRIAGRKTDLINRGGQKIDPAEVERVLESHPSVARAIVVGEPHLLAGETTRAFVVPAGREHPRGGELRRYCAARLAIHKVPDHVEFVAGLPVNDAGEVMRSALRGRPAPGRRSADRAAAGRGGIDDGRDAELRPVPPAAG